MSDEITPELVAAQLKEQFGIEQDDKPLEEVIDNNKKAKKRNLLEEVKQGIEEQVEPEKLETKEDESVKDEVENTTTERVFTEIEKQAMESGWKPDGEKSAEEFIRAEPLYAEIKARGKEIKELKATLDELKAHMDKQRELGYKQAYEELLEERKIAIELGDVKSVDALDNKIRKQEKLLPPEVPTEVTTFVQRHADWINDPSFEAQEMRAFAKKRDEDLVRFNLSAKEHLEVIEKDLRLKFPNRFKKEEDTNTISAVESDLSPIRGSKGKKYTLNDLTPEQKKCAIHFDKHKIMTIDAYIKQLKEDGQLN
jgi:hypothetical protein